MRAFGDQRLRFAAVTVAGFGIDFGLTLALSQLTSTPLLLAATAGFLTALACNYLLFEFWAFGRGRFSAGRMAKVAASAGCALAARLGVIWLAGRLIGREVVGPDVAAILAGAAASVAVNYLVVSKVFAAR